MAFIKSACAALVAASIAFGAMSPISTSAFATDQGQEVKPVIGKKTPKKFSFANFKPGDNGKKFNTSKYLAMGTAFAQMGYAFAQNAYRDYRD